MEELLASIKETCTTTKSGRTKVYELIKNGSLDSVKIGRRRLVVVESIHRLIESKRDPQTGDKAAVQRPFGEAIVGRAGKDKGLPVPRDLKGQTDEQLNADRTLRMDAVLPEIGDGDHKEGADG